MSVLDNAASVLMTVQSMREPVEAGGAERLIRETMELKAIVVKQGNHRGDLRKGRPNLFLGCKARPTRVKFRTARNAGTTPRDVLEDSLTVLANVRPKRPQPDASSPRGARADSWRAGLRPHVRSAATAARLRPRGRAYA